MKSRIVGDLKKYIIGDIPCSYWKIKKEESTLMTDKEEE